MTLDPLLDVPSIGMPERRRCIMAMREMKAKARLRHHADPAARNMAEQHRAGRLTGANYAYIHAARGEIGPARIILGYRSQ